MKTSLTIAETFVGCGGSHLGFKKNGFETVFVNDIWKDALFTLSTNNKELTEEQVICEDICKLDCNKLLEQFPKLSSLDVLMGGVVCKGFSMAGLRNPYDERNYLYLQQLRLVESFKPKISVIENVPGMVSMKILQRDNVDDRFKELDDMFKDLKSSRGRKITLQKKLQMNDYENDEEKQLLTKEVEDIDAKTKDLMDKKETLKEELSTHMYSVLDDIKDRYNMLGYTVYTKVICCADFGGYTNRRRLFIVAIRNDIKTEWTWPEATHDKQGSNNLPKWRTVGDALSLIDYIDKNNPIIDIDNKPMNHKESSVEKFKKITSKKDKTSEKYFSRGSCQRLNADECAPTLVPGHSAFQIHPKEHRSITVREGATISGFPTDYKFCGSHSDKCMQIGNAIPVHLSYAVALQVKKHLDRQDFSQ